MSRRTNLALTALTVLTAAVWSKAVVAAWTMPTGGPLASIPLVLKSTVPPNVLFALSVEFPTAITAAYPGASDYAATNSYLGYFDAEKCYDYSAGDGWFFPNGSATSHACTGSWSGNFLNWATMTGLDEFRSAMTGGNRYVDTATATVLERSYQSNQGSATSNFSDKTFSGTGATPMPGGTAITIKNWNQGINMAVTNAALTGDVACAAPAINSGNFSCGSLKLTQTNSAGTCATWSGTGTSGSPYQCTAFGAFDDNYTITSINSITKTQQTNTAAADTVTCTNPTGGASFSCTLKLASSGDTGSCTTWTGTGLNSAGAYTCTAFGTFSNGESITSSTPAAATSVALTGSGTISCNSASVQSGDYTKFGCTPTFNTTETASCNSFTGTGKSSDPYKCSSFGTFTGGETFTAPAVGTTGIVSVPGVTVSCVYGGNCTLPNGSTATCATWKKNSGTNSASNPYHCTAFNSGTGAETVTGISSYSVVLHSSVYYDSVYVLDYNALYYKTYTGSYTGTLWYVPSYAVNQQTSYYYASSYNVGYAHPTTYAVRVKVCDSSVGVESNCVQYGSNYKPEGSIQSHGQKMRFGMFSYFNANYIDNAVMRSKAKYVAPVKWSADYGTVANGAKEWSATDGTFIANPDNTEAAASYPSAVSNSGVINYVNKFGRASQGYKTYDTVGKLYYEALKYLRGLSPTTGFYNQATNTSADGFPIITTWDDPFKDDAAQAAPYACRKSYIIAMGDTHTWCDKELPGGSFTSTGNGVCNTTSAGGWSTVGANGDMGGLSGDSGVNVTTYTNKIQAGLATSMTGAGGASFYMAGLANWANSQDIRTDLVGTQNVKTIVIDVEEKSGSQVDCGYNSQYWYAAKYGGADSIDGSGAPVGWSTNLTLPAAACGTRAPPWYSASTSSSGEWPKNLLRGNDPAGMKSSVNNALETISAQNGQVSALAQSSGSLVSGGAYLYRAGFSTKGWTGDVSAYLVDTTATLSSSPTWTAAAHLPSQANRVIFSFNDGLKANGSADSANSNAHKGVSFDAAKFSPASGDSNFSSRQKDFLNSDPAGTVDSRGSSRVAYLRGDQTNEAPNGFGWRVRPSVLGDIIDSNPAYVGVPRLPFLPGTGYSAFANSVRSRTPVLYVGGNDGMLHGFDASPPSASGHTPGKELMAFVPSAVYSNLNRLMWPDYGHTYFADGSPAFAEACFNSSGTCGGQGDWKTVLVSGLKGGGKSVFALDITDPTNFTAAKAASVVLWEFTNMDDADLGYTFSNPIIRLMNNGKWAAIFGNGFNNSTSTGAPGDKASSTGRAYLYIVFLDGPGAGATWASKPNYVKIELKSPSEPATATLPLSPANGLASIAAIDKNADSKIDYIYAGDLQGNLWKIDVTSASSANWSSAFKTGGGDPVPLFTATDGAASPSAQPITGGFTVSAHPNGGYLVMVGTGSYVFQSDATVSGQQSLYGIWDQDNGTQTIPVLRSQLQKQEQVSIPQTSGGVTYYLQSNCKPNYTSSSSNTPTGDGLSYDCPADIAVAKPVPPQMGWVFDFPNTKERAVADRLLLEGGILTATTMAPTSTDPCSGGSTGWGYDLDYLSGGRADAPVYTTSPTDATPVVLTITVKDKNGNDVTINIFPSGEQFANGASDTPARFTMLPSADTNASQGTAAPVTTTIAKTFIRGLGVPAFLSRGVAVPNPNDPNPKAGDRQCQARGILRAEIHNGQNQGTMRCPSGSLGRVLWRQLAQ